MAPNNSLSSWGNEKTMNLNTLILTNIQSSPYFKVQLFELKTFHEVVDEIYYRVDHLEPWEKGSRRTAGQTGMCGGVRGVGAGGIVSSAYCLLFKLFTLKLTKKQVNNLITHNDSPFIRGLGFMYIRYSQPPHDLWDWYEPYLDDEEELDVKAGGGHIMTIGEMLRQWLVKLEWYSTLFPRIPVPIQKELDVKLRGRPVTYGYSGYGQEEPVAKEPQRIPDEEVSFGEAEKSAQNQRGGNGWRGIGGGNEGGFSSSNGNYVRRSSPPPLKRRSPPTTARRSPHSRSDFSRDLERERDRQRREQDKDSYRDDKRRSRSRSRSRDRRREEKDGRREKDDSRREKDNSRREKEDNRREKEDNRREKDDSRREKDYRKEHKKEKKSHKHSKERSRDKDRERSRERDVSRERRKESKRRSRERDDDIPREREKDRR